MSRPLFCQLGPWAYALSTWRCRAQRRAADFLRRIPFALTHSDSRLPMVVYRHSSLICRTLGQVDPVLQKNKAVNLALAAPRVDGILLRPGETFSFWRLVGPCTARRGYRTGLIIKQGRPDRDIGGGMCQFTNLLHWMVLHTPLTVTEYHHHDGVDLFPDFGRKVPFGTGTSILYNYLDYRVRNDTPDTWQLCVWLEGGYLCGEIRCSAAQPVKYHVRAQNEAFVQEADGVYRVNDIVRTRVDKRTGNTLDRQLLKHNHARVQYDVSALDLQPAGQDFSAGV